MKIAVFVSGGGTNLQSLIDAQKDGRLGGGEIDFVVSTNPKAYAIERAKLNGIDYKVFSVKSYENNDKRNADILANLKARGIELIVLAGYLGILSGELIECYKNRIINIHPSLIPAFCGKGFYGESLHQAVFDSGVKVSGATVHFVDSGIDSGAIIMQRAVDIDDVVDAADIQQRVLKIEHELLPKAVGHICRGEVVFSNGRAAVKQSKD